MATDGNEKYLRALLLLNDCGYLVTKTIIQTELNKLHTELNKVLNDNRKKLEIKYKQGSKEHSILFPQIGGTDIDQWNLSLLIKVILAVFSKDLSQEMKDKLYEIKDVRNELAHFLAPSLTAQEYEELTGKLEPAFVFLASELGDETSDVCKKFIKTYTEDPFFFEDNIERLKRTYRHDDVCEIILQAVKQISGVPRLVLQKLDSLCRTNIMKMIKVGCHVELSIGGISEEWVNLSEVILTQVIDKALKRTESRQDFDQIRKAVDSVLFHLRNIQDVSVTGCKQSCIRIYFECTTFSALQSLLKFLNGPLFTQELLQNLTKSLNDFFSSEEPVTIRSRVPPSCWETLAYDLGTETEPVIRTQVIPERQSLGPLASSLLKDNKMSEIQPKSTESTFPSRLSAINGRSGPEGQSLTVPTSSFADVSRHTRSLIAETQTAVQNHEVPEDRSQRRAYRSKLSDTYGRLMPEGRSFTPRAFRSVDDGRRSGSLRIGKWTAPEVRPQRRTGSDEWPIGRYDSGHLNGSIMHESLQLGSDAMNRRRHMPDKWQAEPSDVSRDRILFEHLEPVPNVERRNTEDSGSLGSCDSESSGERDMYGCLQLELGHGSDRYMEDSGSLGSYDSESSGERDMSGCLQLELGQGSDRYMEDEWMAWDYEAGISGHRVRFERLQLEPGQATKRRYSHDDLLQELYDCGYFSLE